MVTEISKSKTNKCHCQYSRTNYKQKQTQQQQQTKNVYFAEQLWSKWFIYDIGPFDYKLQ